MPLIVIPFILFAIISLGLAVMSWLRVRAPGSSSFALMMLAIAVWLITAAIETSVATQPEKIVWAKIAYLGIGWIGTLWLAFALEFTYPENRQVQHLGSWLGIIPAITIALAITNDQHGLIWSQITPLYQADRLVLVYTHGAWFWIFTIYSYLVLAAGAVILVRGMVRFPKIHRKQVWGLIAGMVLPGLANLANLFGLNPLPGVDLSPFAFALSGGIYAWTFFRLGLFDLVPMAHQAILDNIGEGYLVFDPQHRLIEINGLACRFLNLDCARVIGHPDSQALSEWPDLMAFLLRSTSGQAQTEFTTGGTPPMFLEACLNDWYQDGRRFAGQILILRDITRRRLAEQQLRESERLYRLLVNNSPVGIALTDDCGKITFASPMVYDIFNQDHSVDMTGQPALNWIHPDERPLGAKRMMKTIQDQEYLPTQEYRFLNKDGTSFWGEITSVPVIGDQGESRGLLAILRDVSARKELELRLKHNLDQQTFFTSLLQILYRPRDLTQALSQVLERTGLFMAASRVYLCQDSQDKSETNIMLEWCASDYLPRAQEAPFVRYGAIPSWRSEMEIRGMVVIPDKEQAPEDLAELMYVWGVQSLAAFPIYSSEEKIYGFLGLDYCRQPHAWDAEELEHLWSVCRLVSGAVSQRQIESDEKRQRNLAEALHDTSSALNSTLNFEEVLDRILANLSKVVQHDAASIAMVDDENYVYFVRWRGYDAEGNQGMLTNRMPLFERETFRWMALTGEPVIIADTWVDRRWILYHAYSWVRSYAGVPIQIKGKVVGFINLDCREPDVFNPDLAYSLHVFADQAAVAIENARLYNEVHQRAEEVSTLYRIGMTLTAGIEMNQVLISLYEQCCRVLPIDIFYVAVFDAETGCIEMPLYMHRNQAETIQPRNIYDAPCLTGDVILKRQTIYIPDAVDETLGEDFHIVHLGGEPAVSYIGVPLILLDQVVGVISIQNFQPHAYTDEQVGLLETIATQAAIAVQNARLYNQMKQMAITDSVTQLYTRRHFTTQGQSEVERALRYNRTLSVMMVDIDRFKTVNDTYGHLAGDHVLQIVANVARQALRATDIIGRWGGEEFALVLPEADSEGAALIAERIRRMVSETAIQMGPNTIHVTISIGVATLADHCCTLETLLDAADRAMYLAKEGGRNLVRVIL